MFPKLAFSLLLVAASIPVVASAHADVAIETTTQEGVFYKFKDSDLLGTLRDANIARIPVRNSAARLGLTRPRCSFVPELLKSVEGM